jgi:hypothetical protein
VKEHGSLLLKAIETLKKTHADVDREEDNPQVQGLKHRILGHIEKATHAAEEAHTQWLKEAKR